MTQEQKEKTDGVNFDANILPECPNCKTKRGLTRLHDAVFIHPCDKCNVERDGFFITVKCWKQIRSKKLRGKNVFPEGIVAEIGTSPY